MGADLKDIGIGELRRGHEQLQAGYESAHLLFAVQRAVQAQSVLVGQP